MKTVDIFNRHMMVLARESRGLTQSALADRLNVGQGTVSKIEAGLNDANDDFVSELSVALSYDRGFFFEPGRVIGLPPFHYRRRRKLGQKSLSVMIAEMNVRRIHLNILLRSYDFRSNGFIPQIDRDEYLGSNRKPFSIERVTQQLRDMWQVPSGPIDNVIELIESNGGIVIPCNFDSDLIDAVSQRLDGLPVFFFVNMNAPADRIRLTLCHELAHMVLHMTSVFEDDEMETEADRFASAFLMPADQIRPQLVKFDIRQTAVLKKYWKVSMAAIAMRAYSLNLITPYQKKMFFMQMSKLEYRKREPNEPPKEKPQLLKNIVKYHLSVLGYTISDLAKTLFVSEREFRWLYQVTDEPGDSIARQSHLRIVK